MENKLYYQDSYIKSFSTNLLKADIDQDGNHYVVLEETAFYPTGGGQPFDTGTINGVPVYNVEEIDGEIRHYLEYPIDDSLRFITGQINWNRRFDHMKQHLGQHILSAAFEELFNYQTVGFHLGQETVTIDLDIEELSKEEIWKVENRANEIILENIPVETKWVSEKELIQYPLRKQPTVTENIRLVIIPGFDYNGCGGTHPKSTGEIGAIKVLDWERQRKKVRLQFVCGNRVLKQLDEKQGVLVELTKLLNAPESIMVESVTRILENAKSVEKQLDDAKNELIQYEAKELLQKAQIMNDSKVITKVLINRSMKDIQKLAKILTNEDNGVIVLLVGENGTQLHIVAARGNQIKQSMKDLLASLLPVINGKGGGNDAFSQGGGDAILSGNQLLQKALETLN